MKAPPRLRPPAYVPVPRQVYAHVHGQLDVSCPKCQTLHQIPSLPKVRRRPRAGKGAARTYDNTTGILTCRGCGKRYYVGILLWPLTVRGALPEDHVPGTAEVAQLARGWAAGDVAGKGKSGRVVVNAIGETEES